MEKVVVLKKVLKAKTKRSTENLIIYTDPSFPLASDNIFTTAEFYTSFQEFEKLNEGMKALVIVPKDSLPKSKKYKVNRVFKKE